MLYTCDSLHQCALRDGHYLFSLLLLLRVRLLVWQLKLLLAREMNWLLALLLQLACKLFLLTFVFELLLLLQLSLLLLLDDDWVQGALCLMSFLISSSKLLATAVLESSVFIPYLSLVIISINGGKLWTLENSGRGKFGTLLPYALHL